MIYVEVEELSVVNVRAAVRVSNLRVIREWYEHLPSTL